MLFSKRITLLFTIALFLVSANCSEVSTGNNRENIADSLMVISDKDSLEISYFEGDSETSVTKNVVLVTYGNNGSQICWTTSDNSLISITGVVSRPTMGSGDASVTLTAIISKGQISKLKTFTLVVRELGCVIVNTGTVTDKDGNTYATVKIGNQEWMAENLRVTKFNDGSSIAKIINDTIWDSCFYNNTPAYCYYNNTTNSDSINKFGALYNWYAVNTGKLAPPGWHVPDTTDWNILKDYLVANGYNWDGTTHWNKIAKSMASKTDWMPFNQYNFPEGSIGYDLTKNNRCGFSAYPSGLRDIGFGNMGIESNWWSITGYTPVLAFYRRLFAYMECFDACNSILKNSGLAVRLVKN